MIDVSLRTVVPGGVQREFKYDLKLPVPPSKDIHIIVKGTRWGVYYIVYDTNTDVLWCWVISSDSASPIYSSNGDERCRELLASGWVELMKDE